MLKKIPVFITIKGHRQTKYGDYRYTANNEHHITINNSLNKYAFLITLIHEFAHVACTNAHGNEVRPHGKQWKFYFHYYMDYIMVTDCFPEDVSTVLKQHILHPKASTCSDNKLCKVLHNYDEKDNAILVESLSIGDDFIFNNKLYNLEAKKRTRFLCKNLINDKKYLISAIAKIQKINL